jgi:hypothetical protein
VAHLRPSRCAKAATAAACVAIAARGSVAHMARAAVVLGLLVVWGCSDNPYVIGRHAPADAGTDAGAVAPDAALGECGLAHAGAVLCSGFEQGDLAADFEDAVLVNAGALERSTGRVHSGSGALHAASDAMMSVAVVWTRFAPLFSGDVYLRAYLYVPAELPTEIMNIFFLGAEPVAESFVGFDLNLDDGRVQVFSPQADRYTGELPIPRDRWFCFRWRIAIDDTDGVVQAFVDDALALEVTELDTLPAAGVSWFRAGIDWSSQQDAYFEIYIDDVVLDTVEVDCL